MLQLWWCPESPYYLVRNGKHDQARDALQKLTVTGKDVEPLLRNINLSMEKETGSSSNTTFRACFQGTDRRRTIASIVVFAAQPLVGSFLLIGYATYFFELTGMGTVQAFTVGMFIPILGLIGTLLSWPIIAKYSRRTVFNYGLIGCTLLIGLIGALAFVEIPNETSVMGVQCALILLYILAYGSSIGPISYVIQCEISSVRLREKTIAIANVVNALANLACAVAVPYGVNPDAGNLKGKLALVFVPPAVCCIIWSITALPETKGRTFDELDHMFEKQVPTRNFEQYVCPNDGVSTTTLPGESKGMKTLGSLPSMSDLGEGRLDCLEQDFESCEGKSEVGTSEGGSDEEKV